MRELEPLTHNARMRRMVEYGRRSIGDARVARTLDDLERGGFYERYLAMQSCFGSGDGTRALRGLNDVSRRIRGLAIVLIPLFCDDAQVATALSTLPLDSRIRLLRRLHTRRREGPVDAYVVERAEADDRNLAGFLPFASEPIARRYATAGLTLAGDADWRRLARTQPDVVADILVERIGAMDDAPDPSLLARTNAVLPILAASAPMRALDVARASAARVLLSQLSMQALAERRPAEVGDLVAQSDDPVQLRLDRVAHHLELTQLQTLLLRHGNTLTDTYQWFRRLAPPERRAIFEAFGLGWRDRDGAVAHRLVALLPADQRVGEGRRHLHLAALEARPAQRLPYASFLPWQEARAATDPYLRDPDADMRGAALSSLIGAVRSHRMHASDVLALVRARRNEQDPVRHPMLSALAALPPSVWRPEHLPDLGAILRDALDAADLSTGSTRAAQSLVLRLLPFHPEWSAAWLATLARERGVSPFGGASGGLSDADVRRIAPTLLPVLREWDARERELHLVSIARAFGRRLEVFDELVDLVERVAADTRDPWTADWGLDLLARFRRDRLQTFVPALLRADRSWITRPVVHTYLHRHRQDLLTPYLGRRAYRGRFSTGRTRYVLPFSGGFHRWTPRQQAVFAGTLSEVTSDRGRDTAGVQRAVSQLSALPAVPPETLTALATDEREAIRVSALRALGRLDGGQGIPVLLDALADDRASIAIYALRRVLLEMPSGRAFSLLHGVPLDRVTVAKEVVRLYGDLDSEDAYRTLLALDAQDLHRDVRGALIRALWEHLEREETWPILERAAASGEPPVASVIGRLPVDRLSPVAEARAAALLATLLRVAEPQIRLALMRRCSSLPLTTGREVLLPELLSRLTATASEQREAAATAVFALADGGDAGAIGTAIEGIITRRRALVTAVQALQNAAGRRRALLPIVRAVLAAMESDPHTAAIRIELAIRTLPWDEVSAWLRAFAASGLLHPDALVAGQRALAAARGRPDAGDLASLEEALAASDDERIRRLGLTALVVLAAPPRGWSDDHLARLRIYRTDESLLVASAAQFTLPMNDDRGS